MARFRVLPLLLATAACHGGGAVSPPDACTSCLIDGSSLCFPSQPGGQVGDACASTPEDKTLGDTLVDTNFDAPMCEADYHAPYCMISGTNVTISAGAMVTASGIRPLLVVAYDTIVLDGTIDVGSHRTPSEVIGAAADTSTCETGAGVDDPAGGTGGAGGSFQFPGGAGGAVGAMGGGQPLRAVSTVTLHGGCRGAAGGNYQGAGSGAEGHSGGALYLMARNGIKLGASARVLANGEGGGAAGIGGGGGGGGTGGMIVLDAPMIAMADSATILAEGGGGGGGGALGGNGQDGGDAIATIAAIGGAATAPAGGGGAGSRQSAGGAGGAGPTGSTTSTGGGGGGGGASGYVLLYGTATGSPTISPAPGP
ncbi:MAG: hypothetical protein ACM31C_30325 [Acidobacteriota bacterium]